MLVGTSAPPLVDAYHRGAARPRAELTLKRQAKPDDKAAVTRIQRNKFVGAEMFVKPCVCFSSRRILKLVS